MPTLVVPGVSVRTQFDVLPAAPAPSGIIGIVGVVDRPPEDFRLVGVSKVSELRQLLGQGTSVSMREAVHALANGASEVVISPVKGGSPASRFLVNSDSENAVLLRCRFNRNWGADRLHADARTILDANGDVIRVALRILVDNQIVEEFNDLRVAPNQPDDLFDTINQQSNIVVALDPGHLDLNGNLLMPQPSEGDPPVPYSFPEPGDTGTTPTITVNVNQSTDPLFHIIPVDEVDTTDLTVEIKLTSGGRKIQVIVRRGSALQEEFKNLVMNPDSSLYLPFVLQTQSQLIRVRMESSLEEGKRLPMATPGPIAFTTGGSPAVSDYQEAINRLADDKRVDLVLASIEPARSNEEVRSIHQALVAHAVKMADDGAPRLAFCSVTDDEMADASLGKIKDHASFVRNRRCVLVAPSGAEGAVAGMVGRMNPQDSPTFKPVPLHGIPAASFRESQLNRLLGPNINLCVVQAREGRGIIVLRGLTTIGDQISVMRVADQAIRTTKALAENFIGQLNTEDARIALRGQIVEAFTRMERENAIVPSTDGTDPAFIVDVYSTQQDFAQGIVRIDIAIRPVRAIDFIYATIRVKN